jgi:hypothetical protein
MRCGVVALTFLLLCKPSAAWEHDGFRSGMSDDEVAEVMLRQGDPFLERIAISNAQGAYMLRSSRKESRISLVSCKGALYEHSTEIVGGVLKFAILVGAEEQRRGIEPTTMVQSKRLTIIISTWRNGDEIYQYLLQEDLERRVSIAEIRTDLKAKSACG